MRTTHQLEQGSPDWHQFRLEHGGASEAAAMLGISKKVQRNELLRAKKTGSPKQFSDWVQANILDYGHEVEAMARPLIEAIIGDELYPATMSDGFMSASCDGITLDNTVAFEHKQWNEALAASVAEGILPDEHMPQCQQVLGVTGAKKLIFVVSNGTSEKLVFMWIEPDPAYFERLRAGWVQFQIDLDAYVPVEVIEKPVAMPVDGVMTPVFQLSGKLTIAANNLPAFKSDAAAFIERINVVPETDEQFVKAELEKKECEAIEQRIAAAKTMITGQFSDIDEALRTLEQVCEMVRAKRLQLGKAIDTQKAAIKDKIHLAGRTAFQAHVAGINAELAPVKLDVKLPDFVGAMKNKRTVESLKNAVDTALANGKIAADTQAAEIRQKLEWYRANVKGLEILFSDLPTLTHKPMDDFMLAIKARIDTHEKAEAKKVADASAAVELARQNESYAVMESPETTAKRADLGRLNEVAQRFYRSEPSPKVTALPAPPAINIATISDDAILEMIMAASGATRIEVLARIAKLDLTAIRKELDTSAALERTEAILDAAQAA